MRAEHREGKEGQGGREACALSGLDDDFGLGTRDTDLLIQGDPSARGKGYVDISSVSENLGMSRN